MTKLKELREEKKLTQKEFGAQIGYSQRAISNWETGITEPNIENLKQIAAFFNVSVDYLIDNGDEWGNTTGIQKSPASLPADAQNILALYNTLSPERKREAAVWLKTLNELDNNTATVKKFRA